MTSRWTTGSSESLPPVGETERRPGCGRGAVIPAATSSSTVASASWSRPEPQRSSRADREAAHENARSPDSRGSSISRIRASTNPRVSGGTETPLLHEIRWATTMPARWHSMSFSTDASEVITGVSVRGSTANSRSGIQPSDRLLGLIL